MKVSILLIKILAASPLLTNLPEMGSPEEAIQDEILFKIATEELAGWRGKPIPSKLWKTQVLTVTTNDCVSHFSGLCFLSFLFCSSWTMSPHFMQIWENADKILRPTKLLSENPIFTISCPYDVINMTHQILKIFILGFYRSKISSLT